MLSREQIIPKVGDSALTSFQCEQVQSFVNDLQMQYDILRLLMTFELYLVEIGQKEKLLSGLCSILLAFNSAEDKARTDWEKDLNVDLLESRWQELQRFNYTFSHNVAVLGNRLKLLKQWCLTPKKLARMNPQFGDRCWRCRQMGADYLHMWWGCLNFGGRLVWLLSQIFGMEVPKDDPRLTILLDFGFFKIWHHRLLLANLLTAACILVAKTWKLEESPSMEDWIIKVRLICLVSKLSALNGYSRGVDQAITRFTTNWAFFIHSSFANNRGWNQCMMECILTVI